MNVLFSWNGQNLDPQMGPKWPWWHCRDSFRGKNSHLSEQGLQNIWHKDMIVSCIRNINAPYLWFWGDEEGGDKPYLWRVHHSPLFPFFPACCATTGSTGKAGYLRGECVQRLMLTTEISHSMCRVSAPYRRQSWWAYSSWSGSKHQRTHCVQQLCCSADLLLSCPAPSTLW